MDSLPQTAAPRRGRAAALVPMFVGEAALLTIGWSGFQVAANLKAPAGEPTFADFHAFFLAGRLVLDGHMTDAYSWSTLQALEKLHGLKDTGYLPFAYPPPFALAMAGLATLPVWQAFTAFVVAGLAALGVAVWRFAPTRFWPMVLALCPVLFLNVMAGQNGMLTAGLAGLAAGLTIAGRSRSSGAAAGVLAALKPQVSIALPLLFVMRRDWQALAVLAATAAALCGIAVAVLGPASVTSFLAALSETSRSLMQGRFPLHRMTSVYAFLRSFGAPAAVAMALHAAAACAVLAAVAALGRRLADVRSLTGLALMATAFVSPYFYDYDGTVVGLGLALLLPALSRPGAAWRVALPLAAFGLAETCGTVQALVLDTRLSLGAPLLLACLGVAMASLAGDGAVAETSREAPLPA